MRRDLKHRFEGFLLRSLFRLSQCLPLDISSWLGGFMARHLGPIIAHGAHRTARKNLTMIYPDMHEADRDELIMNMWDNLGRTAAELPHLPNEKLFERMNITGVENLPKKGEKVIFISGHYGNWEMTYPVAHIHGIPTTLIYRHINNPHVDKLMAELRGKRCSNMFPKGNRGAVKMAHAIKNGESLAMLIDQKMNDGISVPFFGREAMTAPAVAQLALRYDMPIIPARVVRTGGVHFEGTIYPPLNFEKTGDTEKDVLLIMTQINAMLEGWIREHPEQWFWVHKRWPKELI